MGSGLKPLGLVLGLGEGAGERSFWVDSRRVDSITAEDVAIGVGTADALSADAFISAAGATGWLTACSVQLASANGSVSSGAVTPGAVTSGIPISEVRTSGAASSGLVSSGAISLGVLISGVSTSDVPKGE